MAKKKKGFSIEAPIETLGGQKGLLRIHPSSDYEDLFIDVVIGNAQPIVLKGKRQEVGFAFLKTLAVSS